ncbi:MAG: DUF4810 domain-containing protein [Alphaproteobacteria bacterium]|nr:DUF4810 domain-containing protein [Alphaproteobacteria bacterium]
MTGFATLFRTTVLSAVMLTVGACVQDRLYTWNDYEGDLYGYYKDPEKLSALMAALQTTIAENEKAAEAGGTGGGKRAIRMPPGLYAEYGYLLLLSNRQQEAKEYFQKEKDTWPESSTLMDRMLAVAANQPLKAPAVPAGQASAGR